MFKSVTQKFMAHEKLTLVSLIGLVLVACVTLGFGSILVLEGFRKKYHESVDTLFFKRNSLQKISSEVSELRRHENLISAADDILVEMQNDRIKRITIRLTELSNLGFSGLNTNMIEEVEEALNSYFASFKEVADWVSLEGDVNQGLIWESESAAASLHDYINERPSKDKAVESALRDIEVLRVKYIYTSSNQVLDELNRKTTAAAKIIDDKILADKFAQMNALTARLVDLRTSIRIKKAGFLSQVLTAHNHINKAMGFLDQQIKTVKLELKQKVYHFAWFAVVMILIIFSSLYLLIQSLKKTLLMHNDRTQDLRQSTSQLAAINNGIPIGILSFTSDGKIIGRHSRQASVITAEKDIADKNFFYLILACSDLSTLEIERIKTILELCDKHLSWSFLANQHHLPKRIKYIQESGKILDLGLTWSCIEDDSVVQGYSIFLEDESDAVLERKISDAILLDASILMEIIDKPTVKVYDFFVKNRSLLEDCCKVLTSRRASDSKVLGLQQIEHNLMLLREHSEEIGFDILVQQTENVLVSVNREQSQNLAYDQLKLVERIEALRDTFLMYRKTYNEKVLGRKTAVNTGEDDSLNFIASEVGSLLEKERSAGLVKLYYEIRKRQEKTVKSVLYRCFSDVVSRSGGHRDLNKKLSEAITPIVLTTKGCQTFSDILTTYFKVNFSLTLLAVLDASTSGGSSEIVVDVKADRGRYLFSFYEGGSWAWLDSLPSRLRLERIPLQLLIELFKKNLVTARKSADRQSEVKEDVFKNLRVLQKLIAQIGAEVFLVVDWQRLNGMLLIEIDSDETFFEMDYNRFHELGSVQAV